jgi:hypothetical protein
MIWYVLNWTDKAPFVEDERSLRYWYKNSSLRAWNHPSHVPSNSSLGWRYDAISTHFEWHFDILLQIESCIFMKSTQNWSQSLSMVCWLHLFSFFNDIFSNSCPLISGYLAFEHDIDRVSTYELPCACQRMNKLLKIQWVWFWGPSLKSYYEVQIYSKAGSDTVIQDYTLLIAGFSIPMP